MATKWMQAARTRMQRKGTVGSLRTRATREGVLSGKDDALTSSDLDKLAAIAKRRNDGALMRKVNFARNARKGRK